MIIGLLFSILGAPVTLGREVMAKLIVEIDRERLISEESIKAKLQESQLLLQEGKINEEEYDVLEAKLIQRLKMVRAFQSGQETG